MLDEQEFLSPHGVRSVSRWHDAHPYVARVDGKEYKVTYQPAESDSAMFGGNSNWRGPVWFPMNVLLIRALTHFHAFYGNSFRVECPTGSGTLMTLSEVATEISDRLQRIFLRDEAGRRPVFGGTEKFQQRPALARLHSVLRVPPRRQRRRPRRQPPDRLDGPGRGARNRTRGTAGAGRASSSPRAQVMKLEVLDDVESVARHAAGIIAGEARAAVQARGRFVVAISGGRTPWVMLRELSSLDVPWQNVHLLQVDERIAPAGSRGQEPDTDAREPAGTG